ncbi:MAG: hypothetical protein K2N33_00320, partial [Clostridia bacterium]|nr:hypothetical protein [Clostridia bacterium]
WLRTGADGDAAYAFYMSGSGASDDPYSCLCLAVRPAIQFSLCQKFAMLLILRYKKNKGQKL